MAVKQAARRVAVGRLIGPYHHIMTVHLETTTLCGMFNLVGVARWGEWKDVNCRKLLDAVPFSWRVFGV